MNHARRPVTPEQVTVTSVRWSKRHRRTVVTHPRQWKWTDDDGTERFYDTKTEALAAIELAYPPTTTKGTR